MPSKIVTLPRSYKKYFGYDNYQVTLIKPKRGKQDKRVSTRFFVPLPGIQIKKVKARIKVSIYQTTLPTHCQSDQCKVTLLSALQSLQSISKISRADKIAETEGMAKAIANSLSDYLQFDSEEYFDKLFFLNTIAWMLLLFLISIVVLTGLAIPVTSMISLMLLVPVAALCLGLMTGSISNSVSASRQLEMAYKKLIAAIASVNEYEMVNERRLEVIEELSDSSQSLESANNTDMAQINAKPVSQAKNGLFSTASQFRACGQAIELITNSHIPKQA